MQTKLQIVFIVVLVSIYGAAAAAVLHPHVSGIYKAYFINHTSPEWNADHYPGTPEAGMVFSRDGLPSWVRFTVGLSYPEGWGRWTDENFGNTAGLMFNQNFSGPVCVDFAFRAVPWVVGKTFVVRMGGQTHPLPIPGTDLTRYQVQFTDLPPTDSLEFLLPEKLPSVIDLRPSSGDTRRLALSLATMRITSGLCPSS